jgi:SagB-type dehydrogenase family enzyme
MRTAPSAGATYPIELYFVIHNAESTKDGIYYYDYEKEGMSATKIGKFLPDFKKAALDQEFISKLNLAAIMIFNPRKIEPDYGPEARKYAILECGHIAQNLLLMATSLGLGAVPVGAFSENELAAILGIDSEEKEIIYMVCIGSID